MCYGPSLRPAGHQKDPEVQIKTEACSPSSGSPSPDSPPQRPGAGLQLTCPSRGLELLPGGAQHPPKERPHNPKPSLLG